MSPRRTILVSALYGAYAWTVYGIVEYFFSTVFPLIQSPAFMLADWHWPTTGLLLTVYILVGLLAGAAGGVALSLAPMLTQDAGARRAVATLPIVFAFGFNILTPSHPRISTDYIVVCFLPLLVLTSEFSSKLRQPLASAFASPWAVSLLLLGPCVAGRTMGESSLTLKATALLVGVAAVIGLVLLWRRFLLAVPERMALGAAAAVLLIASVAFDHGMPEPSTVQAETVKVTSAPASVRPNVILIVMDTVRADHLSLYGYDRDTTPNMKRVATAATVYTNAIAASDMSLGTHASIFTGRYASWHGAHYDPPQHRSGRPLDDSHPTIASILAENAYRTAAVVANYAYFSPRFGVTRGFQICDARIPVAPLGGYSRLGIRNVLATSSTTWFPSLLAKYRNAEEVNRSAIRLIEGAEEANEPFFLTISYMDAHEPYLPPKSFAKRYPRGSRTYMPRDFVFDVVSGRHELTEDEKTELIGRYDGSITYIDAQIAELFAWLKRKGIYDNTLLIITADHGEAFGERGLLTHAMSVYQDQVHIPLIIKYPGQTQAQSVGEFVSQIDLLPTVLDVLGIQVPLPVQGLSLRRPHDLGTRYVFSESFPNGVFGNLARLNRMERTILHGSFKLIYSSSGRRELYDLSRDPEERHNLYNPDDGTSKALTGELERWVSSAPSKHRPAKPLDNETFERLRSLGYVQ